ncbi:hypothetical protein [Flavobacterium sp. Leaf359]|uniref:hypothetical protein n=1 Tax=Flavobacterium sp. Leaf359 TaxID=1736351 RepID=UPI000ADA927A|nr:hypothetical protein [Flavobacterium sp. Leaf359]
MSTQIKNTLFRFMTMRAPELTGDEKTKTHFAQLIDVSEHLASHFIVGIKQNTGVSKKALLQNLAANFESQSLKSKKEISHAVSDPVLKFSEWLTRNRDSLTEDNLLQNMPSDITSFDLNTRVLIWDNLFYQIISQKSPYLRESLLSLLVTDLFLTNKKLPFEELKEVAKARIIIPKIFFENETEFVPPVKGEPRSIPVNSKALDKKLDLFLAEQKISRYQETIKELNAIQKSYNKSTQMARENAYKQYEQDVKDIYASAQTVEKKYTDKDLGIEKTLVEYVGVTVPPFEFDANSEIDFALSSPNISAFTESVILNLSNDFGTLTGIIGAIEGGIIDESNTLIQQNPGNQEIVNNGGILTPINTNTIGLGNVFSFIGQNHMGKSHLTFLFNNAPQGADVIGASYNVKFPNGTIISGTSFDDTWVDDKLKVTLFREKLDYSVATNFTVDGELLLSNNTAIQITGRGTVGGGGIISGMIQELKASGNGSYKIVDIYDENTPGQPDTTPVLEPVRTFGFRRLGITDYRKVEQEICCYVPGEVSHIENIMAREFKEKTTRRSRKTEDTTTTSSEQEIEKLTDTSTTERHEMNQEVASVMAKDTSMGVQAGVHWGSGQGFGGEVNASYANNTSSETSNSQAVMYAKEITERALDRVVQKVKEERTTKIIEEFSEEDTHGFDNRKGDNHISGVYRWVDKIYKNKVVNYGKRLMYEFMIPEPSSFHNEVTSGKKDTFTEVLVKPIDPRTATLLPLKDSNVLVQNTYKHWAAIYNAEIEAYPDEEITVGESFAILGYPNGAKIADTESNSGNGKIKVPEGYKAVHAYGIFNASSTNGYQGNILSLSIGNTTASNPFKFFQATMPLDFPIDNFEIEVPVSFTLGNHVAGDIVASVRCKLTEKAKQQWRLKAFNAIIEAYEAKLAEYQEKLAVAKATGEAKAKTNPGFYRQVENTILRKNCIAYMLGHENMGKNMLLGSNAKDLRVKNDAELDIYTSQVKFLEQAFEWDLMSYHFYPFYWANKEKWAELYNPNEANDPIFRAFLQSGMARVILTVRPGFEEAVNWFMATGQVWNGGQVPAVDDPLFVSIIKELQTQEGEVEETWESRVPTSLTIIQAGSMGLNVVNALPCNSDCDDNTLFDSDGQPILDAEGNPVKSFVKTDALIGDNSQTA